MSARNGKDTRKLSTAELEEARRMHALDEAQHQAEARVGRSRRFRRNLTREAAAFTAEDLS